MDNTFLIFEWAHYYGCNLSRARKLTEAEKKEYIPELQEKIFVGMGNESQLPEVTWRDAPERPSDGVFLGCSNQVWVISETEYQAYMELNENRVRQKREMDRIKQIEVLRGRISELERMEPLPTPEEAREREWKYNMANNEGGYGYVPKFYSQEDLERYRGELKALENGEL